MIATLSAASACAAGSGAQSHVLTALGVDPLAGGASRRLTLGRTTTADEVDRAVEIIRTLVGGR